MISEKGNVEAREACEMCARLVSDMYRAMQRLTVISGKGKGNVEAREAREAHACCV
jgi:hypothetical protein